MNIKKLKTIFFDMDGSLYNIKDGSFENSSVYKKIIDNTILYIEKNLKVPKESAESLLKKVQAKYNNSISVGLEKEYGIDRIDYFNFAWNIDAEGHVEKNNLLHNILQKLSNDYNFVLISDAPKIWINKVLEHLEIKKFFKDKAIFSGESNTRKEFNNAFEGILKKLNLNPQNCISVGDQKKTDIIPAKKLGMKTIFINNGIKSKYADNIIDNIIKIEDAINKL